MHDRRSARRSPEERRIESGPGQESVWDYPRPPRIEPSKRPVRVEFAGVTIADSAKAVRVLETSSPPTIYIPPNDVLMDHLKPVDKTTYCEWKGDASYFDIVIGEQVAARAAWTYPTPKPKRPRSLATSLRFRALLCRARRCRR